MTFRVWLPGELMSLEPLSLLTSFNFGLDTKLLWGMVSQWEVFQSTSGRGKLWGARSLEKGGQERSSSVLVQPWELASLFCSAGARLML